MKVTDRAIDRARRKTMQVTLRVREDVLEYYQRLARGKDGRVTVNDLIAKTLEILAEDEWEKQREDPCANGCPGDDGDCSGGCWREQITSK